jgi:hypothetical protein
MTNDWTKIIIAIAGGIVATFVGFFLNQRQQKEKAKEKDLKEYIIALQSTANELGFYKQKLTQLSDDLAKLSHQMKNMQAWVIPSYSVYPDFLEKCKGTLNVFFKNPDLVRDIGHCHFELCHIKERLESIKTELQTPIEPGPVFEVMPKVSRIHANVEGLKLLVDSNLPVFGKAQNDTASEKLKTEQVVIVFKEQSLFSGSD